MPRIRRKVTAILNDFQLELNRLERLDSLNQKQFSSTSSAAISKHQLHFITESIFLRAFRAYECFIRDIFLLYCLGKRPKSGRKVEPYLNPIDFLHAENLIQSSMRFIEWSRPDIVIERAETYLRNGFPIKIPYSAYREDLMNMARLRNHIAHDSQSSLDGYSKLLRKHYGIVPLSIPSPGEYLLLTDRAHENKYKLKLYFEKMRVISSDLT